MVKALSISSMTMRCTRSSSSVGTEKFNRRVLEESFGTDAFGREAVVDANHGHLDDVGSSA